MKKLLSVTCAAIALIASTSAMAQTHNSYVGEYGGSTPFTGPPNWAGYSPAGIPNDTSAATPTVTNTFTFTGTVASDCSFYGGSSTSHAIPLGAIGVRNSNNEGAVGNLFNQAASFTYEIGTSSAGCNTNNTVTVSKNANGLQNSAASGFDSNQFTNKIPYSVLVGISNATTNTAAGAPGTYVPMTVAANAASNSETLGAWRSNMNVTATFPAQTLGLLAGTYSDTITVTLAVNP